jgi:hypothetical protein
MTTTTVSSPGGVFFSIFLKKSFTYFLFLATTWLPQQPTTTAMTGMSITHCQHQHHQRVETLMAAAGTVAAAAGARDETRLEPLVCVFFFFLLC